MNFINYSLITPTELIVTVFLASFLFAGLEVIIKDVIKIKNQ